MDKIDVNMNIMIFLNSREYIIWYINYHFCVDRDFRINCYFKYSSIEKKIQSVACNGKFSLHFFLPNKPHFFCSQKEMFVFVFVLFNFVFYWGGGGQSLLRETLVSWIILILAILSNTILYYLERIRFIVNNFVVYKAYNLQSAN